MSFLLIIFFYYQISLINSLYLSRAIFGAITIFIFTSIFHFALEKPIRYIRKRERETIIEHFLFFFFALIVWGIIDFGYYFESDINSFLIEKIWFLALSIPIIYFFSFIYRMILNRDILLLDLTGMLLAISIGSLYEIQLLLNRLNPATLNNLYFQMGIIIGITLGISIILKIRQRLF